MAVRIDCGTSYIRRCIKGPMMRFKEETDEGINATMIELTKTTKEIRGH